MLKIGDKVKIKAPFDARHNQGFYNGMTGVISRICLDTNTVHVDVDRRFFVFCFEHGMVNNPTINIKYIQNKVSTMPTE